MSNFGAYWLGALVGLIFAAALGATLSVVSPLPGDAPMETAAAPQPSSAETPEAPAPSEPEAQAEAEPAEEPLDPWARFQGLRVLPSYQTSPQARAPRVNFATRTAPASSNFSMTVAVSSRT